MQIYFRQSDYLIRTKDTLAADVLAARNEPAKASETGVRQDTILNSLIFFHTLNSGPDAMHDLLGGI